MVRSYRFGDVEIDLQGFRLLKDGKVLPVEPKALHVLVFLVENRGRLVERRELIDKVWSGAFVTDHVLNRAIGQLRKVLAEDAKEPRYIETAPTLGYRFIADVQVEQSIEPALAAIPIPPVEGEGSIARAGQKPSRRGLTIGIAVLLVCAAALWIGLRHHRANTPGIRSLAVLPFENLSGDGSQEYLADGMTGELITDFGQIASLRVISQTTAMQYRQAHKPLPQIAKELNVDAVVEGSVLRVGDRIQIMTRLVNATTEKQLWTHSYEGDFKDVLGLQNQVAGAVADQIRVELTAQEQSQLAAKQEVDPRAYEAVLKGNYFFEKDTPESAKKSLEYFQQAVKLDPSMARAYVGVARSYNFLGDNDVPVGEATAASDMAVAKALELDPRSAEAYAERGWTLLFYHWDFPGAERDFRHAFELEPGLADAHEGYSDYLEAVGRVDEGLGEMQQARDLDPLSPLVLTDYCNMLHYARRFDDALQKCSAALELDPNFAWALEVSATIYFLRGQFAEANKALLKEGYDQAELDASDDVYGAPGKSGDFDAWVKKQGNEPPDDFILALAESRRGRRDEAFALLEKAYKERIEVHRFIFLAVDPDFDALRADPRFDAFLRHAGLPPQIHPASVH